MIYYNNFKLLQKSVDSMAKDLTWQGRLAALVWIGI